MMDRIPSDDSMKIFHEDSIHIPFMKFIFNVHSSMEYEIVSFLMDIVP